MTDRPPARDGYDVIVELFPPAGVARAAYALVRRTYRVSESGRMHLDAPRPITLGVEGPGPLVERWGDVSFARKRTDVMVRGSAHAPGARLVARRTLSLRVGERVKRIEVFGRRVLERVQGSLRFSDPEPFAFLPVSIENAYGGSAPGAGEGPLDPARSYPRNPVGKGYLVGSPVEGIELPNLEDPAHLLTPKNLVVEDPREWWKQPVPACFEPLSAFAFPRALLAGASFDALPPPGEELEEHVRGLLPRDWQTALEALAPDVPPADFAQRASHVFAAAPLAHETRLAVDGMHPARERFEATVPSPPRVELIVDGQRHEVEPRLVAVLLEPSEERVSFTWSAVLESLPRLLMPTLHASIPLAVRVDGDSSVEYLPPPTLRERIEELVGQIRASRRELVRDTIAPPSPPPAIEDAEREEAAADPPGAPRRLGRIADVEPFVPLYAEPRGAGIRAPAEPLWQSDGDRTGRLVLPGELPSTLPKTAPFPLPESAPEWSAPRVTPPLRPEKTQLLIEPEADALPLTDQPTAILHVDEALRVDEAPPTRERTALLPDPEGEAPAPPEPRRTLYDEPTALLREDGSLHTANGTQVLRIEDLLELDDE